MILSVMYNDRRSRQEFGINKLSGTDCLSQAEESIWIENFRWNGILSERTCENGIKWELSLEQGKEEQKQKQRIEKGSIMRPISPRFGREPNKKPARVTRTVTSTRITLRLGCMPSVCDNDRNKTNFGPCFPSL